MTEQSGILVVGAGPTGLTAAVELARRGFRPRIVDRNEGPTHMLYYHVMSRLAERSEEHTSELQSLMRISYAVFCLKKKINMRDTETTVCIMSPVNRRVKQ